MSTDRSRIADEPFPANSPGIFRRRPLPLLGRVSFALAVGAVAVETAAIAIGSGGGWAVATGLAGLVIGLTAVAFVLGIVAVLAARARRWGVAGVVLSVLANPLVLVGLFSALGARG